MKICFLKNADLVKDSREFTLEPMSILIIT